ncbi:MAG: hypothetical protein K5776_12200 [Lachnospiraceae bacterium]|nr:hypothetical protein [Lachnospiraceae bacterium]
MKNYEKPMVLSNEELAEGVYAASGNEGVCWTISYVVSQEWNGTGKVYELHGKHSDTVKHWSKGTVVTIEFLNPSSNPLVVSAENNINYTVAVTGNVAKITRNLGADSYKSGDEFTYKVFVFAGSETASKLVSIQHISISCMITSNVQGEGGDGT